jgi:hypothetical protein
MAPSAKTRRRWLGTMFLASAAGLLICGLTVLEEHLRGWAFLVYWLTCLLLALLAILVALVDLRAIGRQARQEQHDLVQNAFNGIQRKAEKKPGRPRIQAEG